MTTKLDPKRKHIGRRSSKRRSTPPLARTSSPGSAQPSGADISRWVSWISSLSEARKIRTILVPLDLEERSRNLLLTAAAFAHQVDGHLILLHVCEHQDYAPAHTTPGQYAEWNEALRQVAESRLACLKAEFFGNSKIQTAESIVVAGLLGDEINAICNERPVDLILVSTHANHGIRRLLQGSKAENILRRAICPVLALPDRCAQGREENLRSTRGLASTKAGQPASQNSRNITS
jgi:universal stress protein A